MGGTHNGRKYHATLTNHRGQTVSGDLTFSERLTIDGTRIDGEAKSFDGTHDFKFWIDDTGLCLFKRPDEDDSMIYRLRTFPQDHSWARGGVMFTWMRLDENTYIGILDNE